MNEVDQLLQANEDSVNGEWIYQDGTMIGDANFQRIEWLIHHHLEKVAGSFGAGAWEILYQDPYDGRA